MAGTPENPPNLRNTIAISETRISAMRGVHGSSGHCGDDDVALDRRRHGAGATLSPRILTVWHAFGALDLIVAVTVAFLSAPGAPDLRRTSRPEAAIAARGIAATPVTMSPHPADGANGADSRPVK